MKFKNIIKLQILFIILFSGCSTTTIKLSRNLNKNNTIKLYGQTLNIPKNIQMYIDIPIKVAAINKNSILIGKQEKNKFIFKDNKCPYYIINLKKAIVVKDIIIYNTASYIDTTYQSQGTDILSLAAALIPYSIKYPTLIYIGTKKQKNLTPYTTKFIKTKSNTKLEIIEFKNKIYTNQIHIAIAELYSPLVEYTKSKLYDDYTFLIEGYEPKNELKLIRWTLNNRSDINNNEILIKNIALSNQRLFKKLKQHYSSYKLPKYSIMKLPKDVDLKYAAINTAEIYTTGRYKNKHGKYKSFYVKQFKFNSYNTLNHKKTHQVTITGRTTEVTSTSTKTIKSDYIDFSKGLQ